MHSATASSTPASVSIKSQEGGERGGDKEREKRRWGRRRASTEEATEDVKRRDANMQGKEPGRTSGSYNLHFPCQHLPSTRVIASKYISYRNNKSIFLASMSFMTNLFSCSLFLAKFIMSPFSSLSRFGENTIASAFSSIRVSALNSSRPTK